MAFVNFQNCTAEEYNNIIYSGNAQHSLKLWVDNVEMPNIEDNLIEVVCTSRIIPIGSNYFNINELVSKEVEMTIRDLPADDFKGEIKFSIGTLVDEENNLYEYVPMGIFNVQEITNTDYNEISLKLRDNSVKLDIPYNAKPLLDQNSGTATLKQILLDICTTCGISTKITSFKYDNKLIGIYDNSINARIYVNYIAGQCGAIPIIDRDGELDFKYFQNLDFQEIPLDIVGSYKLGDTFRVSKVIYESGIIKLERGSTKFDTMYVDSANPYIVKKDK